MDFLIEFALQYPVIASALMIMQVLRLINKPLFAFLNAVVLATPTPKDDEILVKVETSKAYTYFVFLLDYFASVKLPQKVVAVPKSDSNAA